jgi:hypothetical protein
MSEPAQGADEVDSVVERIADLISGDGGIVTLRTGHSNSTVVVVVVVIIFGDE